MAMTAAQLGINAHNNAVDNANDLRGAAIAATTASSPFTNPVIGQHISDFVHGLLTGAAPAAAQAAPAPVAAAPAAAPAAAAPGVKAPSPMDLFLAAQIQRQSQPGYGATAQPTPFDAFRSAVMSNPNISLAQVPMLSEAMSRLIPQQVKPVPATAREQMGQQYQSLINDFAIKSAQDPNYAKSTAGAAHQQLIENTRAGLATPNQINDVATGMPPLQQAQ